MSSKRKVGRPRTRKASRPVKSPAELAKKATSRQRRLYGLNSPKVPHHEKWRLQIDAPYYRALKDDPDAALWLSVHHEELTRGVHMVGEPHISSLDEIRDLDRERKARFHGQDVMSWQEHRGGSIEAFQAAVGPDAGDSWLYDNTRNTGSNTEDELIDAIDRARSVAAREREDHGN